MGSCVLADVFTPIKEGKYPIIMSYDGDGKAFWRGCIHNEEHFQKAEVRKDNYFEGIVDLMPFIKFHKRDFA